MLNGSRVGLVAVQWTSIVWVLCSVLFALMPDYSYRMMSTSFHMVNVQSSFDPRLTFGGFFLGLIVWNVIVWLGAQLFVWLWNRSADSK